MKKILLCLCLLFGISFANDKSGLFAGFELGVSEKNIKAESGNYAGDAKASAPLYGINVGYEHYFNDSIGLDVYFGFKSSYLSIGGSTLGGSGTLSANTYMANADFLYDFYSNKNASLNLGVLVGIALGFMGVEDDLIGAYKTTASSFYGDLKVGLRNNFGNNIVSLIATFPIITAKDTVEGVEYKFKRNYSISLAYAYKF